MKQIRVLSVIHPFRPAFSGEGEWWLRIVPFLQARGVEVEILTSGSPQGGSQPGLDFVEGLPVHRIPIVVGDPSYWRWGRGILVAMNELARRRKRFDLMLFHSPNHDTVYASCLAGRVFGWKTIYKITLWGSDDLSTIARSGRIGHLRLATLTLADGFISMSRVALHPYEDQPWICSRLLVAPQGVDLKRFYPRDPVQKRSLRRQLGIPEDKKVVLFCGALIYRKGVDVLIDAWQQVRQQFPDALLLLVGPNHLDGIDEHEHQAFSEAIAHRIMDLKLTDTVRLLGYQRETSPYYAAADVFVLPSRSEGWGTVITEAMASGLPCVISSLHGISEEHLEDNVQGFIVPSHAPKDYAERLLTLLSDETIARRMGKNARSRAEEHFTVERVADQYTDFFRRIVANPRPRKRWTVLS